MIAPRSDTDLVLRATGASALTAARGCCPGLGCMRAVQITRFGGREVLDVVDLPDPTPGEGQQLFDVSTGGVNCADTHHRL